MTQHFNPVSSLKMLKLPSYTHNQLAFCNSNKVVRVREWVEQLRATQAAQTGVNLYRALPEVLRLKTEAVTRYEMLEILRPAVQQAIQGLTKDFLHQPLMLPEQAQKTAIVAQALQKNMIDGYTQVVLDLAELPKLNTYEQLVFTQAMHRGITALGLFFCRSFQLYSQIPKGLWAHLHQLYRCAHFYDLQTALVQDSLCGLGLSSIEDAYTRVLALETARLNQVSQNDVQLLFDALAEWSRHIRVVPQLSRDADNLFVVDLAQDSGPQLKHRVDGHDSDDVIELNFKPLLQQLDRKEITLDGLNSTHKRLQIADDFPASLLIHLQNSWGNLSHRDMDRRSATVEASVGIGISECHYHLAGEQTFDKFLHVERVTNDIVLPSFGNLGSKHIREMDTPRYAALGQIYSVTLQNISAGGYCLLWQGDVPALLEAGELIVLRESGRRSWNLCVVRWVRRLKDGSQTGLQLLSTHAQTFAASAQYDDGSYSDYMRAFYLPAAKQGEVPATLLTAALPFQEFQSVRLKQDDRVLPAKLEKCVFASAKVRQFAFNALDGAN